MFNLSINIQTYTVDAYESSRTTTTNIENDWDHWTHVCNNKAKLSYYHVNIDRASETQRKSTLEEEEEDEQQQKFILYHTVYMVFVFIHSNAI